MLTVSGLIIQLFLILAVSSCEDRKGHKKSQITNEQCMPDFLDNSYV